MQFKFRRGKKIKSLNLGFSWSILFFGPFIFFFRRQFILALIWLIVDLWVSYLYFFAYPQDEIIFFTVSNVIDAVYTSFWIGMAVFGNRLSCYYYHKKGSLMTPEISLSETEC